ncbi:hypothetical protein HYH03_013875 [Edaphochlamys debaryana]|uniref:Uncharacterized protein n=1 Tax=Edaphochlamys debaryana TaxID=47281 RepID=A0A835XQA4_9CHLO|nr:hypothetical protein HYH03_013875 [Edaphochlamys debaryana]|eukprot:KAG2487597.1 hypothetical protein HYH03_013875 [Edaphochlamys debaryana]
MDGGSCVHVKPRDLSRLLPVGGAEEAGPCRRNHTSWLEAMGRAGVPKLELDVFAHSHQDLGATATHTALKHLNLHADTCFPARGLLLLSRAAGLETLHLATDEWCGDARSQPLAAEPDARWMLLALLCTSPPRLHVALTPPRRAVKPPVLPPAGGWAGAPDCGAKLLARFRELHNKNGVGHGAPLGNKNSLGIKWGTGTSRSAVARRKRKAEAEEKAEAELPIALLARLFTDPQSIERSGWGRPKMASVEERQTFHEKVNEVFKNLTGEKGQRWARPAEPILHTLNDEKEEPHIFFHNTNYRTSRKYINVEKVKILREQALECMRSSGTARYHKCTEIMKRMQAAVRVSSNVDRGPLARKRDVGFIYHNNKLRELQAAAAELEIENPFPAPAKQATGGY